MVKVYISVLHKCTIPGTQLSFRNYPTLFWESHDVWSSLGDDMSQVTCLRWRILLVFVQVLGQHANDLSWVSAKRSCPIFLTSAIAISTLWFPEVPSLEHHYRMYLRLSKENIYYNHQVLYHQDQLGLPETRVPLNNPLARHHFPIFSQSKMATQVLDHLPMFPNIGSCDTLPRQSC